MKNRRYFELEGLNRSLEAGETWLSNCRWCGDPVIKEDFRTLLDYKEYLISGMCQKCISATFKDNERKTP